jgi:hypothetical protein
MKHLSDYPRLRATPTCPRCDQPKDHGIVICWTCNAYLKAFYDGTWGPWEGKLAVIEGGLEARKIVAEEGGDVEFVLRNRLGIRS